MKGKERGCKTTLGDKYPKNRNREKRGAKNSGENLLVWVWERGG